MQIKSVFTVGLAILAAVLLPACQSWNPSVSAVKFDTAERAASKNVDVYLSRSQVPRSFKEIGLIVADEGEWDAYYGTGNEAKLIEMIRAKAMTMGAQGIILLGNEQKSRPGATTGTMVPNQGGYLVGVTGYGKTVTKAAAIVYTR